MGGRIITMQRGARELGRLRTGWTATANGKTYPEKSKTWVMTSHAEHYVQAAAKAWGGKVERWQPQGSGAAQWRVITEAESIDALLPPGDPLSAYNEMWSKGGAQRRCDGETELLSRQPCMCLRQFGEEWYLQPKGRVCAATTRLRVLLPDMPDLGVWRAETKSFYAANEWSGVVDAVLSGTDGQGYIPVALRIEPRSRVANGKTKHFPVVVVEIRGITPRQALTGPISTAVALDPSAPRLAIEAAAPDYEAQARMCRTPDEVLALWKQIKGADQPRATQALFESLRSIAEDIGRGIEPGVPDAEDDVEDEAVEAEFVNPDDPDEMWAQFEAAGLALGWPLADTERGFAEAHQGLKPRDSQAEQVWAYIAALREQRAAEQI
jgi:hypothetical protein